MKFRLLPSGDGFFELFAKASTNISSCALQVNRLVSEPESSEEIFLAIKEHEQRGDDITTEILRELDSHFITPFDREDIHALAEAFDDVVDEMYGFADLMNLMKPQPMIPELKSLSETLTQMAEALEEVIPHMKTANGAAPVLATIAKLESEGDTVYRRTMARLFSGEFSALDVLKWKDIVQTLEEALNKIEDLSDVIESIVLKHA